MTIVDPTFRALLERVLAWIDCYYPERSEGDGVDLADEIRAELAAVDRVDAARAEKAEARIVELDRMLAAPAAETKEEKP